MNLTGWKIEEVKVSSHDDLKQRIIVPTDLTETIEHLIEQNVDFFAEKGTDLGRTKIITGNHPPIKLRPCRTLLLSVQL